MTGGSAPLSGARRCSRPRGAPALLRRHAAVEQDTRETGSSAPHDRSAGAYSTAVHKNPLPGADRLIFGAPLLILSAPDDLHRLAQLIPERAARAAGDVVTHVRFNRILQRSHLAFKVRRPMKLRLSIFATAAVVAMLSSLQACSDDSDDGSTGSTTSTSTSAGGTATSGAGGGGGDGGSGGDGAGGSNTGGSSPVGAGGSASTIEASFETLKLVITRSTCTDASCHNGEAQPTLTRQMTDDELYETMISYVSEACGDIPLVTPGNPEQSALIKILKGPCGEIARMPNGCVSEPIEEYTCIPWEYIDALERWVASGAARN